MLPADLTSRGQHVLAVCNACRYCEGYCPVFPAMEQHRVFTQGDLVYLANLCHDCGECLYACQYAPPHEFGIDVPRTMAELRVASYQEHSWPGALSGSFKSVSAMGATVLTVACLAMVLVVALATGTGFPSFLSVLSGGDGDADFYGVMSHGAMVWLFGGVGIGLVCALAISTRRMWLEMSGTAARSAPPVIPTILPAILRASTDAATLRHLHGSGEDCVGAEELRLPWRRWCHHATVYGFLLCFASTSVAAVYHVVFGWRAPYAYSSLPVVLGSIGGIGLLVGPAGLLALRGLRDSARSYAPQQSLDSVFIASLFLVSLTGCLLLLLRTTAAMPSLLIVHLGLVLALFVTLPYGKFVHGLYRTAALVRFALDNTSRAALERQRMEGTAP